MPPRGHWRTAHQNAQTAAMGKQQWLPKSLVKAKAIDPTDSCLRSKERKQYKEDLEWS